jgi:hypothetical protein
VSDSIPVSGLDIWHSAPILHLEGTGAYAGWKWQFLIEGLLRKVSRDRQARKICYEMKVMDFFDAVHLFASCAVALLDVIFGTANQSRVNLPETYLGVSYNTLMR